MKNAFFAVLLCISISTCSPKPFASQPDNQTTTSGTVGSAKMTSSLPPHTDTARVKTDTLH